ncbi:MAG: hypothetical protein HRJ53_29585 [Acidobacteria bacterium Pan2503]|uniref:Uncharacterized protein n=1 Tax=Candidatus Acidiferrum panamense TaxID=2741543 RepID=A0A7V8NX85_9BACT|nr:hypothetical protein [Candidatus Acidoferrum panamensis]
MPASEVMSLFRQGKLHSGKGGPVVKNKKQATAIQISMARKEGHDIPEIKGSMQQGGLVPETGTYKLHEGERVVPVANRTAPVNLYDTKVQPLAAPPPARIPAGSAPGYHQTKPPREAGGVLGGPRSLGSMQQGGIAPVTGPYTLHQGESVMAPGAPSVWDENPSIPYTPAPTISGGGPSRIGYTRGAPGQPTANLPLPNVSPATPPITPQQKTVTPPGTTFPSLVPEPPSRPQYTPEDRPILRHRPRLWEPRAPGSTPPWKSENKSERA